MPQPDAKILLRHAMQALDDEMGVNDAWPFAKRILDIHNELLAIEKDKGLTPIRSIAANISVDRPRLVRDDGGSVA